MSKLAVIGGCGRTGLRLSLISANKGHNVSIIDIDEERLNEISQGNLPFVEAHAEVYLEQALKNKSLTLSTENNLISKAEVVIITIGTPVDSNLNPSLEPVAGVIFDLADYFKQNQLIIFRNTISPQVVGRIKTLIEEKTGFKIGKDIYLAFAPEILNEGGGGGKNENQNIHELLNAPQPIGAFDNNSFNVAEQFFKTITKGKISFLTPEEVLLAKLMNNMYAYIQAACANEFYLISESFGANIHKILESTNNEFPAPNPNASGPGMHKEGWFLVDRIPFADLVTTAFKINESMPAQIVQKLEKLNVKKVAVLGMTNKGNSDDARASLSYKLRKALYYKDYEVACYDPYLPEFSDSLTLQNADAVILMTPHNEFKNFENIKQMVNNQNCVFIDIVGFWEETKQNAQNGVFKLSKKTKKA